MNLQGIKSFAHSTMQWAKNNSQIILAGLGVAGLVATAIATAKGAVKATRIIDEEKQSRAIKAFCDTGKTEPCGDFDGDMKYTLATPLTKRKKFALTWKYYIPAVIIGAGSIACIIGGTVQGQKKLAAMSALYSMSEQALKEYTEKTKELVGEKKANAIKDGVQNDHMNKTPYSEDLTIITGHGNTLMYDDWNGRFFRSDIDFVKRMINDLNAQLFHGTNFGSVTLNELYDALDLPTVRYGQDIGWDGSESIELSYDAKLNQNQEPAIVLEFVNWPKGFVSSEWNGV